MLKFWKPESQNHKNNVNLALRPSQCPFQGSGLWISSQSQKCWTFFCLVKGSSNLAQTRTVQSEILRSFFCYIEQRSELHSLKIIRVSRISETFFLFVSELLKKNVTIQRFYNQKRLCYMVFQAQKNLFEKTILKTKNNSNPTFDFFWAVNTTRYIHYICKCSQGMHGELFQL